VGNAFRADGFTSVIDHVCEAGQSFCGGLPSQSFSKSVKIKLLFKKQPFIKLLLSTEGTDHSNDYYSDWAQLL